MSEKKTTFVRSKLKADNCKVAANDMSCHKVAPERHVTAQRYALSTIEKSLTVAHRFRKTESRKIETLRIKAAKLIVV
jgi:hypothetical protein